MVIKSSSNGKKKINCLVRKGYIDLITWRRRRCWGVFALCEMRKKFMLSLSLIISVTHNYSVVARLQ